MRKCLLCLYATLFLYMYTHGQGDHRTGRKIESKIFAGDEDVYGQDSLTTSGEIVIQNNANVSFTARKSIFLTAGFETRPGARFNAVLSKEAGEPGNKITTNSGISRPFRGLEVFPNPARGFCYIRSDQPFIKLIMTDMNGKIIQRVDYKASERGPGVRLDAGNEPAGMYPVQIIYADTCVTRIVLLNR